VLVGIWFIAEGLVEIVGGFMQRHAASKTSARSLATGMLIMLPSSAAAVMMAIQARLMPMRW